MTTSSLARRVAAGVGVLIAAWCALGAASRATTNARTTADEPQYLMTARSLWFDHDLDVANQRTEGDYRSFHEAGLPIQESTQADGSRVSPHDPLLPLLLAPAAGLGGWLAAKLVVALLTGALAALLVWTAIARFGVAPRIATVVTIAFFVSAPLAVYATQVYPEIPAALCVALAVAAISGDVARRFPRSVALGAIVALPWLSVKYAPIAVVLGGVLVARAWALERRVSRHVGEVAGVAAIAAVAFFILHVRWYGGATPYAAGDHFVGGELTVVGNDPNVLGRSVRIIGLLVDRDFGLAVWQPLVLLSIPASVLLWRTRDERRFLLLMPLAAGWLNATFVALTMHGWWFPGRQVVVVLPLVVLTVAVFVARFPAPWFRVSAAAAVLGASLSAWLWVQSLTTDLRIVTTFSELSHPWWRTVRTLLPDGRGPGAGDSLRYGVWIFGVVLVAVIAAVSGNAGRAGPARSDPNQRAAEAASRFERVPS